jgi:hypothetical protein
MDWERGRGREGEFCSRTVDIHVGWKRTGRTYLPSFHPYIGGAAWRSCNRNARTLKYLMLSSRPYLSPCLVPWPLNPIPWVGGVSRSGWRPLRGPCRAGPAPSLRRPLPSPSLSPSLFPSSSSPLRPPVSCDLFPSSRLRGRRGTSPDCDARLVASPPPDEDIIEEERGGGDYRGCGTRVALRSSSIAGCHRLSMCSSLCRSTRRPPEPFPLSPEGSRRRGVCKDPTPSAAAKPAPSERRSIISPCPL